ncbi:CWF19-like protein 1 [Frankliniella fusca]|uniref:CWF19-like protein 1 n=1 Tax=Frankliniella fusca TaxID=407009 RepID=A0AAE1LCI0_9NEOP|nr:CWF19-like protein 1 [Frankliniella fusca]
MGKSFRVHNGISFRFAPVETHEGKKTSRQQTENVEVMLFSKWPKCVGIREASHRSKSIRSRRCLATETQQVAMEIIMLTHTLKMLMNLKKYLMPVDWAILHGVCTHLAPQLTALLMGSTLGRAILHMHHTPPQPFNITINITTQEVLEWIPTGIPYPRCR